MPLQPPPQQQQQQHKHIASQQQQQQSSMSLTGRNQVCDLHLPGKDCVLP
jgi:hypothetical protein